MTNATQRVPKTYRRYDNDNITHSYATLSSPLQLYTNAHLGLNSSGYLQKFDDTAALRYAGLVIDQENEGGSQGPKIPKNNAASGTQGDGTLDVQVKQPKRIELAISGVTIADVGRRVYALDDQTGTLDPTATTFQNVYGVVADLVYSMNSASAVSGIALVTPSYDAANGGAFAGVYSASGAVNVRGGFHVITKAGVAAMTLAAPTAGTHDGMELVVTSDTANAHTVTCPASTFKNGGAAATVFTFTGTTSGGGLHLRAYNGTWKVIASAGGAFS